MPGAIYGVVNIQKPSACFSMSTFGPLQKLSFTFVASGALNRICTRELPSTFGYCASRTFDVAGLKSPRSCAKQKLAASSITNPITFKTHLRANVYRDRAGLEPDQSANINHRHVKSVILEK